jgi:signal transduction histidine kinase
MTENNGRHDRSQLQFFGKIVAATTHEINNVLSIVNENTGLLADLLAAGGEKGVSSEKIDSINESINKHLDRGKEIIKNLNLFAHSVDQEVSGIDLEDVVENMMLLSQRYARQKKASFKPEHPEGKISLQTDAFLLRLAIFTCFSSYLSGCGPGYEVTVRTGKQDRSAVIAFSGPEIKDEADKREILSQVMEKLGGSFEFEPSQGHIKLVIAGS